MTSPSPNPNPNQVLQEMDEHTFTELDSLVDWKVVSHMAADYGYFAPNSGKHATPEDAQAPGGAGAVPTWAAAALGAAAGAMGVMLLLRK